MTGASPLQEYAALKAAVSTRAMYKRLSGQKMLSGFRCHPQDGDASLWNEGTVFRMASACTQRSRSQRRDKTPLRSNVSATDRMDQNPRPAARGNFRDVRGNRAVLKRRHRGI